MNEMESSYRRSDCAPHHFISLSFKKKHKHIRFSFDLKNRTGREINIRHLDTQLGFGRVELHDIDTKIEETSVQPVQEVDIEWGSNSDRPDHLEESRVVRFEKNGNSHFEESNCVCRFRRQDLYVCARLVIWMVSHFYCLHTCLRIDWAIDHLHSLLQRKIELDFAQRRLFHPAIAIESHNLTLSNLHIPSTTNTRSSSPWLFFSITGGLSLLAETDTHTQRSG